MKHWRTRISLDFVPALALSGLSLQLWSPERDVLMQFAAASSAALAILASVVTFACTSAFASSAPAIVRIRSQHGPRVRRVWATSIVVLVAAAIASLGAFVLIDVVVTRVVGAVLVFASVLALLSTLRAISWLAVVWTAEDAPGIYRLPEHLRDKNQVA